MNPFDKLRYELDAVKAELAAVKESRAVLLESEQRVRNELNTARAWLGAERDAAKAECERLRKVLHWVHENWPSCFHDATSSCLICRTLGKEGT